MIDSGWNVSQYTKMEDIIKTLTHEHNGQNQEVN